MTNTKTNTKSFESSDDWGWIVAAIILLGLMSTWMTGSGSSTSTSSRMTEWTVMGEGQWRSLAADFRGGSAVALMGKQSVDLRSAEIRGSDREVEIGATAVMGKVEIRVPKDWDVEVGGVAIMGKLENGAGEGRSGEPRPRLRVRGMTLMGKVEVQR
jgi:hypothetical protein